MWGEAVWSVVLIERKNKSNNKKREQLKKEADLHNDRLIEYRLIKEEWTPYKVYMLPYPTAPRSSS